MRIDGQVNNEKRHECVNYFQNSEECRIAILAITACATGLTLTKASTVVFAEMYFTPAILIQAEDRAHRIGQGHNCVNVHYLFGKDTIDELIFPELEKKFSVVSNALDAKKMNLDVKNVLKGEKGDIKRRTIINDNNSNIETSDLNANKGSIMSYMVKKSEIKNRKSNNKDKNKEPEIVNNINLKKEFDYLNKDKNNNSNNKYKDKNNDNDNYNDINKDSSYTNINKIENNGDDSFDSLIEGVFNEDENFIKEIFENENENHFNKFKRDENCIEKRYKQYDNDKNEDRIDADYRFNFEDCDINLNKSRKKRISEEADKDISMSNKKIKDYFDKSKKQNKFSTTDELEEKKEKEKKFKLNNKIK
jgi:hypothetical protein